MASNKTVNRAKTQKSIGFEDDLLQWLEDKAAADNRSLSNYVETKLREIMDGDSHE